VSEYVIVRRSDLRMALPILDEWCRRRDVDNPAWTPLFVQLLRDAAE
jgi:hypothetical protein